MKKVIFACLITCCISYVNIFCESYFSVVEDSKLNEIYIEYVSENINEKLSVFNYIPSSKNLYKKFPNGNIIGYLPIKDENVRIKAWNDLKYNFSLIYCDLKTKSVTTIETSTGWDFHILDQQENQKWIVISPKGKSRLLLINGTGNILNDIEFTTNFSGDYVTIKKIDNSLYKLMISMLGRDAFYEIDLEKNESKFLYEKK